MHKVAPATTSPHLYSSSSSVRVEILRCLCRIADATINSFCDTSYLEFVWILCYTKVKNSSCL